MDRNITSDVREGMRDKIDEGGRAAGRALKNIRSSANRAQEGVSSHEHREGTTTKAIEYFTSQVPSGTYLGLAIGSIAASAALQLMGRKEDAHFVGQWVPTILIMGLYNKLVKLEGSE